MVFLSRAGLVLFFTDLLQQIPAELGLGLAGDDREADYVGGTRPSVPRKFRIAFTNRRAARKALRRASWRGR